MNRRRPDWARPVLFVVCGVVLVLAACFGDGPPTPYERCLLSGGHWIARPQPDSSSGISNYCSFPDGTECAEAQIWNHTCPFPDTAFGRGAAMGGAGVLAYPRSVEELIGSASLIFVGEVGPVVQYLDFGGYGGADGAQLMATPTDASDVQLAGIPVTDFFLHVEEVIRDDGSIAAGEPIILRILGFATAETKRLTEAGEFPLSYTGDRHLFLLGANPDGTYGLTYGPRSRLIVDGDTLRVSDGDQSLLRFGQNADPVRLDELIRVAESQPPPKIVLWSANFAPHAPPGSLQALVRAAPLIFVGAVGPVEQYLDFAGYGDDGQLLTEPPTDGAGVPLPMFPMTDFRLIVETVIRDDGTIARGDPIIWRTNGHITEEIPKRYQYRQFPISYTGDRHLFLLAPNLDGTYDLAYGAWGRLIIDGDLLRVSDGTDQPLQFAENPEPISLDQFIQFVEAVPGCMPPPSGMIAPIDPQTYADSESPSGSLLVDPLVPPQSLDELVSEAPLIIVGEVGPVARYPEYCCYGENGQPLVDYCVTHGGTDPSETVFWLTEFVLHTETVIRDDGTLARGEPIILQMAGRISEETKWWSMGSEYPYSFTGDRYLFLLTPNPDGRTYRFRFGPWSRLNIDGDILRVSNGAQTPLQFANSDQPITLDEFMRFVGVSPDSTHTPPDVSAPVSPLATPGCTGMGLDLAYPTSLEDLVDHASLVFFGEVGPVVEYLEYCGYEDGQLLEKCKATDIAGNPAPGLPLTYFVMQVDQVIRDDGRIARGEPVILAEMGHVTPELKQLSQTSTYPLSYTGEQYLYLLGSNPDGETYGAAYGPRGRLIVDGDILRISDCEQSPLRFGADSVPVTLEELIQVIAESP